MNESSPENFMWTAIAFGIIAYAIATLIFAERSARKRERQEREDREKEEMILSAMRQTESRLYRNGRIVKPVRVVHTVRKEDIDEHIKRRRREYVSYGENRTDSKEPKRES